MSKIDVISSLESLKDFIISKDNSKSNVYFSPIPDYLKTEKCILGGKKMFTLSGSHFNLFKTVDEAGRGPILGNYY